MMRLLYFLFGLGLAGAAGVADYRGMSLTRPTELQNVPRTIRDNPGAYRSLYRSSPRFFGGK